MGLGAHQAGHRPPDTGQSAPVRRLHDGLHRPGKALVFLLHLRQQTDAVLHGVGLAAQLIRLLGGLLGPAASALHLQAVALDDVGRSLLVLPGGIQGGVILCRLPAALVQFLVGGGAVGGDGRLGNIAIRYGYYRYQPDIMIVTIVILIVLVQILQGIGMLISAKLDRRK